MSNKTQIVAARLKPIIKAKLERYYTVNLRELLEALIRLSENNNYIKNKIKNEIKKGSEK